MNPTLTLAATGFVSSDSGSVASANAVLMRALLARGIKIAFFSKPTFVDPRPAVENEPYRDALTFIDCTNRRCDHLRNRLSPSGRGILGKICGQLDSWTYNQGLVRAMRKYDDAEIDLWLGDWSRGRSSRPVVSYVQGPPGTDARSIAIHRTQIIELIGYPRYLELQILALLRLSVALPNFHHSDKIILGSQWSRKCMQERYGVPLERTHAIPYPIDLKTFVPQTRHRTSHGPLRLLWLGRFVPRKRLDLFLRGLQLAIDSGCDVIATIVGRSGMVENYERLIQEFSYPQRLTYHKSMPRAEVSSLLSQVDVTCQPSDEENFGSSVAESLACGVPAIVGATNGTADYVCERSIHLHDDKPETLAAAIVSFAEAKKRGELRDPSPSRAVAEKFFDPEIVTNQIVSVLKTVGREN